MADGRGPHGSPHTTQGARGMRSRSTKGHHRGRRDGRGWEALRPVSRREAVTFQKHFLHLNRRWLQLAKRLVFANAPTRRTPYGLSLQKKRLKPGVSGDPEQKARSERGVEATQPEGLGRNRQVLQERPRPIHCHCLPPNTPPTLSSSLSQVCRELADTSESRKLGFHF